MRTVPATRFPREAESSWMAVCSCGFGASGPATSYGAANAAPAAIRTTPPIFAFRMRRVLANANSPVAYLTMMYIPDL